MARTEVKRITDQGLEELLVGERGFFAVAFMSVGSVPCDHFQNELSAMPELMGHRIKFFHLDVDENPTIVDDLKVISVPSLIVFKGETEVKRFEGPYSREALKQRLETVLLFKKPDGS